VTLSTRSAPLLALALLLTSCGEDDEAPTATTPPATPEITVSDSSPTPLDRIEVEGIPAGNTDLVALVNVPGSEARAPAHVEWRDDVLLLRVPLHPERPVEGGAVEIRITDGADLTSLPATLTLDPLPPAPGPIFAQMVDRLAAHLDAWLATHGVTRAELRASDVDGLPAVQLPLLLAHDVLDSPDNPSSLRALVEGGVPYFGDEALDLDVVDRLLARTDVLAYLDSVTTSVDSLAGRVAGVPGDGPRAARDDATGSARRGCLPAGRYGIDDASELSGAMDVATHGQLELQGATGQVLKSVGAAAGALAVVPALKPHASAVGGGLWVYQKMNEAAAHLLPSRFDDDATEVVLDPARFDEDDPGPGSWRLEVTAESQGWTLDRFILDSLMQLVGIGGSFSQVLGEYGDFGATLLGYVLTQTTNQVIALTPELDLVRVCPQTWPGIDVSPEPFTLPGRIVDGTSIVPEKHRGYRPDDTGTSMLRVETSPEHFGNQVAIGIVPVEVSEIDVDVSPAFVDAEPQDILTFEVSVDHAIDESVDWVIPAAMSEIDRFDDGRTLVVQCPPEPWSPALLLTAVSATTGGIRGRPGAPDRTATATIGEGEATVLVEPSTVCLEPGEEQTFAATVLGVEDTSVTWSTDPPGTGSFEGNLYTAPSTAAGEVLIVATSVADPTAEGIALAVVSGCACWWSATVTGDLVAEWSGPDARWVAGLPGSIHFDQVVDTGSGDPDHPLITGLLDDAIGEGEVGSWDFAGTVNPDPTTAFAPGHPDDDRAPVLHVDTNDGTRITGRLTGPFFRPTGPDTEEVIEVTVTFTAVEASSEAACDGG